jgi:uncharacterized protein (DUF885 family)
LTESGGQILRTALGLSTYTGKSFRITDIRKKSQLQLGDKFDVREFHNQVLLSGALPMAVLEAKIDRWVASQK